MDIISREKRSWNMSRIKNKNTEPELAVRTFLHKKGLRFRLHSKNLPGKPDIVIQKYKTVVFVHGCFWHRHPGCKYAYIPKTRIRFWKRKFIDNIKRFNFVCSKLKKLGWRILIIWECESTDQKKLSKILKFLK